jgi:hypothetical protein
VAKFLQGTSANPKLGRRDRSNEPSKHNDADFGAEPSSSGPHRPQGLASGSWHYFPLRLMLASPVVVQASHTARLYRRFPHHASYLSNKESWRSRRATYPTDRIANDLR